VLIRTTRIFLSVWAAIRLVCVGWVVPRCQQVYRCTLCSTAQGEGSSKPLDLPMG
jgi:hypothetical protein